VLFDFKNLPTMQRAVGHDQAKELIDEIITDLGSDSKQDFGCICEIDLSKRKQIHDILQKIFEGYIKDLSSKESSKPAVKYVTEEKAAAQAADESQSATPTDKKTDTPPKEKKSIFKEVPTPSLGLGASRDIDGKLKYLDVLPLLYIKNTASSKVLERWVCRF